MKLTIKDIQGKDQGEHEITLALIENNRGVQAVHDVVTAYRANQRMGTACTKTAGEVAGTNKKPWRQKGTGRARAGSFQSPLWRGGGVVFGPKPRDFSKKVNAKVKTLALQKAFSSRLQAGDVTVVNEFKLAAPKTKDFLAVLKALDLKKTVLVVAAAADHDLMRASRNAPNVELTTSDVLNTYQVLRSDKILFTQEALLKFEQRLPK